MLSFENDKLIIPEKYKKMTISQLREEKNKLLTKSKKENQRKQLKPNKPTIIGDLIINF